jgi:hypothetical protein
MACYDRFFSRRMIRASAEGKNAVGNASRGAVSRRSLLAAMPAGALLAAGAGLARAQPTAAAPVSFYLGQVLALATLQAESIRRIRPVLAVPAPQDVDWQSATTAEAGVIGAVASVLGAMAPPPELAASVGELSLASAAYQNAASAAQRAAVGETAALSEADAGLAEGGAHILLWLDALTAETANDWGDGLRTLTLGAAPAPAAEVALQPPANAPIDESVGDPGDGIPVEPEPDQATVSDQGQDRNRPRRLSHARRGNLASAE